MARCVSLLRSRAYRDLPGEFVVGALQAPLPVLERRRDRPLPLQRGLETLQQHCGGDGHDRGDEHEVERDDDPLHQQRHLEEVELHVGVDEVADSEKGDGIEHEGRDRGPQSQHQPGQDRERHQVDLAHRADGDQEPGAQAVQERQQVPHAEAK
jgi:hypothetical protein